MVTDPRDLDARCSECCMQTAFGEGEPALADGKPVLPEINPGAFGLILAEAPGEEEVRIGRPLVGRSGQELMAALATAATRRHQFSFHNALMCRPRANEFDFMMKRWEKRNKLRKKEERDLLPSPLDCCRPALLNVVRNYENILALGKKSFHALTGSNASILSVRGGPAEGWIDSAGNFWAQPAAGASGYEEFEPPKDGVHHRILPTIHPAFVLRARRWTAPFRADISRAVRWFTGNVKWIDPWVKFKPTPDELYAFLATPGVPFFSYDVETDARDPILANLRCIGVSTTEGGLLVPFLSIDGQTRFYTLPEQKRINDIFRWFFANPKILKVAQNGRVYDRQIVEKCFGVVPAPAIDTLALAHAWAPELPHGLGFLGSFFLDVNAWKADRTALTAETDEELGIYCLFKGTPVVLADGSTEAIETIVKQRKPVLVRSMGPDGRIEAKPVVGWHENVVEGQRWIVITTEGMEPNRRGLTVTPEHLVLTEDRGWVQAGELCTADRIYLPESKLTPEQLSAVLGTLLGDTSVSTSPAFRSHEADAPTAYLQGGHTASTGYTEEKRLALGTELVRFNKPLPGGVSMEADGRRGITKEWQGFRTINLVQFARLIPLTRDYNGRRRLRRATLEMIGDVGLAWWFMDDGCKQKMKVLGKRETLVLSTQRYPQEDVEQAQAWFREQFGSHVYLGADRVLRFGPDESEAFIRRIGRHMPPNMRYKVPTHLVESLPPYTPTRPDPGGAKALSVRVTSVQEYNPEIKGKHTTQKLNHRYCLDVADNHNFFTTFGLVHNCVKDCVITAKVATPLYESVKIRQQEEVVKVRHKLMDFCVGLHQNGMFVDRERSLTYEFAEKAKAQKNLERMRAACGRFNFNPNSVNQMRDVLFEDWGFEIVDETKLGDPSTKDQVIRRLMLEPNLAPHHKEFLDAVRRFRTAAKKLGTYLHKMRSLWEPIPDSIFDLDEDETKLERDERFEKHKPRYGIIHPDGRIHADWNACGTSGLRLSSSNMNMQNIDGTLKSMLIAAPGNVIVQGDMDQLEFRLVAAFSGSPRYLEVFRTGGDAHNVTAELAYGKAFLDAVGDYRKKLRQVAKILRFSLQYGGSVQTVHEVFVATEDKAGNLPYANVTFDGTRALVDKILEGDPYLARWWESELALYRKNGYLVECGFGMRRDFLDGEDRNEILNFRAQSTGAAITHMGAFQLLQKYPFQRWGPGTGFISQVHDSLAIECPAEWGDQVAKDMKEAMTRTLPGLDVPFTASVKVARPSEKNGWKSRWSEV
jgi:DNA polymerase I-like protein with 3'-5' exonuclease and polymerase domains/uracil-DNA glycosylase